MEVSYKRNINGNFMVINSKEKYDHENFELQMMLANDIPSLIKIKCESIDGDSSILYDISQKHAISKLFTGTMSIMLLRNFILSLGQCIEKISEYLLNPECLILNMDTIFMNLEMNRFWFCYNPFYEGDANQDLRVLLDKMITKIDFKNQKLVKLAYQVRQLTLSSDFYIGDFVDIMGKLDENSKAKIRPMFELEENAADENINITANDDKENKSIYRLMQEYEDAELEEYNNYQKASQELSDYSTEDTSFFTQIKRYAKGKKLKEIVADIDDGLIMGKIKSQKPVSELNYHLSPAMEFREKSELAEYSERAKRIIEEEELDFFEGMTFIDMPVVGTRQLKDNKEILHILKGRKGNGGSLEIINKESFTIGKMKENVDMVLESPAASRLHARIYAVDPRDGEGEKAFLLEDLNSTNGTFLNGKKLAAYTKKEIKSGDVISFADEEFSFN